LELKRARGQANNFGQFEIARMTNGWVELERGRSLNEDGQIEWKQCEKNLNNVTTFLQIASQLAEVGPVMAQVVALLRTKWYIFIHQYLFEHPCNKQGLFGRSRK
jgi:hypothetical protein